MFGLVLSIIGVAFAVWSLLPPARKEMLRITIVERRRELKWQAFALLAVVLAEPLLTAIVSGQAQWRAYVVLAGVQLIAVTLVWSAARLIWPSRKWSAARLRKFRPRIEPLIMRGRAATVVDVLAEALHSVWIPPVEADSESPDSNGAAADAPPDTIPQEEFTEVLEEALPHNEFIRTACRHDRAFVAAFSRLASYGVMVGFDRCLRELMFGGDGLLIRELQSTTNFDEAAARHHYRIADRCVLLHALFDDVAVADRLAVWKPIGDGAIEAIHANGVDPKSDQDQRANVKEEEAARWDSPLGSSLWFFRLMITSAIKQGHRYDMWSAYLPRFIETVDQILVVPDTHAWAEFPNPYCEWVADCFRLCDDAVGLVPKLAQTNPNRNVVDSDALNDTAIDGVLYTLGLCIWQVVTAERLPERVKQGRIEHVCMMYEKWSGRAYPDGFAMHAIEQMISSMPKEIGEKFTARVSDAMHARALRQAYCKLHDQLRERFS